MRNIPNAKSQPGFNWNRTASPAMMASLLLLSVHAHAVESAVTKIPPAEAAAASTASATKLGNGSHDPEELNRLRTVFEGLVTKRTAPDAARLEIFRTEAVAGFSKAGKPWPVHELVFIADVNPKGQEGLVGLALPDGKLDIIGTSKVSTGKPGSFDHFRSPVGVFENSVAHPSYRAEGTFNSKGIRGYGVKGMRVWDLGWTPAEKGWGKPGQIDIRLMLHATDPKLEAKLGSPASKGCIRVDAGLNRFLDQYGVLDANYERAAQDSGKTPWVFRKDRTPTAWSGRWVVLIDAGDAGDAGTPS